MPKETWIIGSLLTVAVLVGLLAFNSCERKQETDQAQAQLEQLRAALAKDQAEASALRDQLSQSQAMVQQLQQDKDAAVQSHKSLEDEMRAALESKDVTISRLQGKLTVNIVDRVLFDSGEAVLKGDGEAVLRKVADILSQHPQLKIQVVGHTDNVPIRAGARSRFPSNWELSTARATAAVRFLTEKAGVDPRRLGIVGYGEYRPVADNATPEGRAKNRRIALIILPDELADAEMVTASSGKRGTPAAAGPDAETNSPAPLGAGASEPSAGQEPGR